MGGHVVIVATILAVGTADKEAEDIGFKFLPKDFGHGVLRVRDGEFLGEGVQGFRQLSAHDGDDVGGEVGEGGGRHDSASAMKPAAVGNVITWVGRDSRDAAKCLTKSIMKTQKLRCLFLGVGLALLGAAMVAAQPTGGGQGQGHGKEGKQEKQQKSEATNPRERLQQLVQHLELTPAQVEQLRPIMATNMQEMRSLRQDGALQGKALREKAQALREENRLAVRAILTREQQAKFDAMPQSVPGGPPAAKQVN